MSGKPKVGSEGERNDTSFPPPRSEILSHAKTDGILPGDWIPSYLSTFRGNYPWPALLEKKEVTMNEGDPPLSSNSEKARAEQLANNSAIDLRNNPPLGDLPNENLFNQNEDSVWIEAEKRDENSENNAQTKNEIIFFDGNDPKLIECRLCLQAYFDNMNISPGACLHQFCKPCFTNYLREKITTSKVMKILCPEEGCSHAYTDQELSSSLCLSKSLWQKLIRFRTLLAQERDPFLRACTRPGCEKFIKSPHPKTTRGAYRRPLKLTCECGKEICDSCLCDWHQGKACRKRSKSLKIRPCPKCGVPIEKTSGCNHMTCERCEHEFCWICLEVYKPWHYKEWNILGCPRLRDSDYTARPHFRLRLFLRRPWKFFLFLSKTLLWILYLILRSFVLILCLPNILFFLYVKRSDQSIMIRLIVFVPLSLLGFCLAPFILAVVVFPPTMIWICRHRWKLIKSCLF